MLSFCSYRKDTRPGLVPKTVAKQYEKEENVKVLNEKYKTKPRKQLETEKREEGLQKTLGSENKGFNMLQRMGFKPGMTIGKRGKENIKLHF